ncbi:MAG: carbohydrate ABC transporter permease [Streptococcaceae bacterium]|jgi:multiple sugar transport system permease protein|nr:carbohydrate ABC transporter permease [Streptococcaceae bacterium]
MQVKNSGNKSRSFKFELKKISFQKMRRVLLGRGRNSEEKGWIPKLAILMILVILGFVFLLPIIFMISTSFKSLQDLLNSQVGYIPSTIKWSNYSTAFKVLDYWKTFGQNLMVAALPTFAQVLICSIIGYGLAIYDFKGKRILFSLILATFIIPSQITVIPQYILFFKLGLLGSIFSTIFPALLGQGLNSAIFILIFYQGFRTLPHVLLEAARLDGAGEFQIFRTIGIPSASQSFLISFLFSFVWYWNETFLASLFFGNGLTTLPLQLQQFDNSFSQMFPAGANPVASSSGLLGNNEAISMAATLLTIFPLLIMYFIAQKWFVESVERSGIAGE